jgi:hypothetical protein
VKIIPERVAVGISKVFHTVLLLERSVFAHRRQPNHSRLPLRSQTLDGYVT